MKKCLYLVLLLMVTLMAACSGDRSGDDAGGKTDKKANPAIAYWQSRNQHEVLLWEETDLDGDKELDTVFIYRVDKKQCQMAVISKSKEGFKVSQSSRAPLENQTIKFKDIDEKLPVEIIVSGSKQGNYGYAILRLEGDVLIDLFAEGMEDCC